MPISRFVFIPISSSEKTKGRKLNRLLSLVEWGDTLIVCSLSQMGFSLAEIVKTVDTLLNREIRLVAIEENILLNGEPSFKSQVIAEMFGILADIGQQLISRRTKEALAEAQAKRANRWKTAGLKYAATGIGCQTLPRRETPGQDNLPDDGNFKAHTLQLPEKGFLNAKTLKTLYCQMTSVGYEFEVLLDIGSLSRFLVFSFSRFLCRDRFIL